MRRDKHPPRAAQPGLQQDGLSWSMRFSLERLRDALSKGLESTAAMWPAIRQGYVWVYEAVHVLANATHLPRKEVQQSYAQHLSRMWQVVGKLPEADERQSWVATFAKVTTSYGSRLFHSYEIPDLPRTNTDLEHLFGSVRYHERRASGRKQVAHSLLVRGAVRIFATMGQPLDATLLQLSNRESWRKIRQEVEQRRSARCAGRRFRHHP